MVQVALSFGSACFSISGRFAIRDSCVKYALYRGAHRI